MSRAVPRFRRNNPALPAAIPNLFEVIVTGSIEGQMTINTFYYADGGAALTPTTESTLLTAWAAAFQGQFLSAVSADFTLKSYKCQCLTSPARIPAVLLVGSAGGGPGGHEPVTVAMVYIRQSGVKGQAGRGRVSMPAVATAWVTNSNLNAAGTAAATAFVPMLKTAFVSGAITYTPQVVSRKNKAGPLLGASPVLASSVSPQLGTIRRRKIGRGK